MSAVTGFIAAGALAFTPIHVDGLFIDGFRVVGKTKRREHLALRLKPENMPHPSPALGMQYGIELVA